MRLGDVQVHRQGLPSVLGRVLQERWRLRQVSGHHHHLALGGGHVPLLHAIPDRVCSGQRAQRHQGVRQLRPDHGHHPVRQQLRPASLALPSGARALLVLNAIKQLPAAPADALKA